MYEDGFLLSDLLVLVVRGTGTVWWLSTSYRFNILANVHHVEAQKDAKVEIRIKGTYEQ